MSRIGKYPAVIKEGVTASVQGHVFHAKGKLGELSFNFGNLVDVTVKDKNVVVLPKDKSSKASRAMWGTAKARIDNIIEGVSTGFSKTIEVQGVGYKVALKGKNLNMALGYSHDIEFPIPADVKVEVVSPTEFKVTGADKQVVGAVADQLKKYRMPEPYKGKGVRYKGEFIRRKEGKKK